MSTAFNTGLPSIRRVHSMIKKEEEVDIKLVTGDEIRGVVIWLDEQCVCVATGTDGGHTHNMLVWYHAIAFIKSKVSN